MEEKSNGTGRGRSDGVGNSDDDDRAERSGGKGGFGSYQPFFFFLSLSFELRSQLCRILETFSLIY